jgi:hypothetical protein
MTWNVFTEKVSDLSSDHFSSSTYYVIIVIDVRNTVLVIYMRFLSKRAVYTLDRDLLL